jgi:multidrug transporter EmrE-like cation transporter
MNLFLLIAAAVLLGLAGDVLFKTSPARLPVLGFVLYASSGIPVWLSYRRGSWMAVSALWQAMAVLISILLGVALFGETLTLRKILAFALALTAAWLAD